MTPASLTAWRERLGLNKSEAAAVLGLSRNAYTAYEAGRWNGKVRKIPKYIALACKCILLGGPPVA